MSIHPVHGFSVTYETYTVDSIINGQENDSGFMCQDVRLRDALLLLGEPAQGYQANYGFLPAADYIIAYGTGYFGDEQENRSLHFPKTISDSSKLRVMRFLGVPGIEHWLRPNGILNYIPLRTDKRYHQHG